MKYLLIALCVIAAIFLILLAVSFYVFHDTFVRDRTSKFLAPRKKKSTASKFMKDIDWESIGKIVADATERITDIDPIASATLHLHSFITEAADLI